jgi:hypothetical protein
MERLIVESSIIRSVGYDAANDVLQIEFNRGHVRNYFGVPPSVYREMITAGSKGKYYLKHIRDKFEFATVD